MNLNTPQLVTLIIVLLAVLAFEPRACSEELPNAPSWDLYVGHGIALGSIIADGYVSSKWAGTGEHPCAFEANEFWRKTDGGFRTKRYFAVNLSIWGATFAASYFIRRGAPNSKIVRWLTSAVFPATEAVQHIPQTVAWFRLCG